MSTSTDVQSGEVILSKSDENLLKHGGEVATSVAEVAGDDPEGGTLGTEIDGGAGKLETGCIRRYQATRTLSAMKAKQKTDTPIIRDAAFGIAKAIRFTDPVLYARVPLQTAYEKQDPVYFIDRFLLALATEAPRYASFIIVLRELRVAYLDLGTGLRKAEEEFEQAETDYEVAKADFQKLIRAGHSYVLKRAKRGSPARLRIKKKSGKRGSRAKDAVDTQTDKATTPSATTTPTPAPAANTDSAPAAVTVPAPEKIVA